MLGKELHISKSSGSNSYVSSVKPRGYHTSAFVSKDLPLKKVYRSNSISNTPAIDSNGTGKTFYSLDLETISLDKGIQYPISIAISKGGFLKDHSIDDNISAKLFLIDFDKLGACTPVGTGDPVLLKELETKL
jgi:hypothetical protein